MSNTGGSALWTPDSDDVYPQSIDRELVGTDPLASQPPKSQELLWRNCLDRPAVAVVAAGLDFADDEGAAIEPDHVDLAAWSSPVPIDHEDPGILEVSRGDILAVTSE